MSENVIQTSFASGELAPSLLARTDLNKYHAGAATMRNFFVDYRSGASTRPGTKYVKQANISSLPVRLIRFQSSVLTPYILEFGDKYVQIISNGAAVLEPPFAITGVNLGGAFGVTAPGNFFNSNDMVFISGLGGTVQANGRFYRVLGQGPTLTLGNPSGAAVNATNYTAWTGGGNISRVHTVASPYAAVDLALIKFVQIANVMYITHPSYPPYILTFISPTNWVFTQITFGATVQPPTNVVGTATTSGSANYSFVVTSVDSNNQESRPSVAAAVANAVNIQTTAGTISLSWTAATGATGYNVYKAELSVAGAVPSGAAYGFIGSCTGTNFIDSNIVPDFTQTPPIANNPFTGGNNPGTCCFFQQRLYYGSSFQFPQTFWASKVGLYNNFDFSDPSLDSDTIQGTLVSLQVNYIKSMLPMPGGLIMLTAQGAWQLSSGTGLASTSAVTPSNATATPQGYYGSSDLPPIPINQNVLYVESKGYTVLDLQYNIYANIYSPKDISVLSNHLFYGFTLNQWAFAQEPFKMVWVVRSDGVLLSLTYVADQEMIGWGRHDTQGRYTSVATVTESVNDAVYVAVNRFINGVQVTFIERFDNRLFPYGAEDAWCVDAGVQSALTFPNASLQASGTTGTITFTSSVNEFTPTSVGQVIRMGGGVGIVTQYVSAVSVQATLTQPITATVPDAPGFPFPLGPSSIPFPAGPGQWSITPKFKTFYGLDHLEGMAVSVLADGSVVPGLTVTNGAITLPEAASKVTVGLGFQAQLQTMPLDVNAGDGGTIQGKRKKIAALTVITANTRGLKAGRTFATVVPIKETNIALPLPFPTALINGYERVILDPLWDVPGQICLQQDNPLPASVLGVVPEIVIGDTIK